MKKLTFSLINTSLFSFAKGYTNYIKQRRAFYNKKGDLATFKYLINSYVSFLDIYRYQEKLCLRV